MDEQSLCVPMSFIRCPSGLDASSDAWGIGRRRISTSDSKETRGYGGYPPTRSERDSRGDVRELDWSNWGWVK